MLAAEVRCRALSCSRICGANGNMTQRGQNARNPKLKAIEDRADEIVALDSASPTQKWDGRKMPGVF